MVRDFVAAVHQIVRHDVHHVYKRPKLETLLFGEGDHIRSLARDRN